MSFFEQVLGALNEGGARYLVVGGLASRKREAGRPQDIADIEALEEIQEHGE